MLLLFSGSPPATPAREPAPDCHQLAPRGDALETIQAHFPLGEFWNAVRMPGKKLYRLLQAFANAYEDMNEALCRLATELNPFKTTELLPEWETACGLPDPCLPKANTIEQRRAQVILRLSKRRWSTEQDWHDLAALFGLTIRITQGWRVQQPALFERCLDAWFFDFKRLGRFYVYVDIMTGCGEPTGFDYDFDYNFDTISEQCGLFQCMLDRVKPACVVILWNQRPVENGWLTCGA